VTQESIVIGCLRLTVVSVICRAVNLRSTSQKKLGISCRECTGQGNDYELIPTVKMETRHPVVGSLGNEFPSIYNHCGFMAASSRKTFEKKIIFAFLEKNDPLRKNLQNSVLKRFIATPIDVLCSNFVKFGQWEIDTRNPAIAEGPRDAGVPVEIW